MRGLTNQERALLTGKVGVQQFMLSDLLPLVRRGLVTYEHLGDHAEYELLPDAELALRLDSAARVMNRSSGPMAR